MHKIDFFPNNSFLFLSIHYMFIRLRSRQYQLSKDNIKWSKYDFLKMKDGKKQWTVEFDQIVPITVYKMSFL